MPNALGDILYGYPCYPNLAEGEGDGSITPNQTIIVEPIDVTRVRVQCDRLPYYNPYDAIMVGTVTGQIIHGHIFSMEGTIPPGPNSWITWHFDLRTADDIIYTLSSPIGSDGRRLYGSAIIQLQEPIVYLTIPPNQEFVVEEDPEVIVDAITDQACKPNLSGCRYIGTTTVNGTPSYHGANDDLRCVLDLTGIAPDTGIVEWSTQDPGYEIAGKVGLEITEPI